MSIICDGSFSFRFELDHVLFKRWPCKETFRITSKIRPFISRNLNTALFQGNKMIANGNVRSCKLITRNPFLSLKFLFKIIEDFWKFLGNGTIKDSLVCWFPKKIWFYDFLKKDLMVDDACNNLIPILLEPKHSSKIF